MARRGGLVSQFGRMGETRPNRKYAQMAIVQVDRSKQKGALNRRAPFCVQAERPHSHSSVFFHWQNNSFDCLSGLLGVSQAEAADHDRLV
jgi:hypothetical protein